MELFTHLLCYLYIYMCIFRFLRNDINIYNHLAASVKSLTYYECKKKLLIKSNYM